MAKNVHEAILEIMGKVGYVQKQRGRNLNYTYASEAALIGALRPAMLESGVYAHVLNIHPERETYTTSKGTVMNVTLMVGTVRFVHAASDTYIEVQAVGEGADVGDKSANKASTGLLKYALRQTFLIETGDDPDNTPSVGQERAEQKTTQRPYTPEQLKSGMERKVEKMPDSTMATQAQRGLMVGRYNDILGGDTNRYEVCEYLFGRRKSSALSQKQVVVALNHLNGDEEMAKRELQAVFKQSQLDKGQKELL